MGSNSASAMMLATASSSASLNGERDHDGAGDPPTWGADPAMAIGPGDSERDRTRADSGEQTTGAGGVSVVTEGDGESSSLGDGVSLGDGNADLQGLDVAATSIDTNPGCAICPTSAEPLEEAGTAVGPLTAFMATGGVVEVGGEEKAFVQWKVEW